MITKTFDPAKYKLVPKVATQEMISRVIDERMNALIEGTEHTFIDIYNAMLAAAPEAPDAEPGNAQLLDALKKLVRGYVSTLETGRDRIISCGGDCDSVDLLEAHDPYLVEAKRAIAAAEQQQVDNSFFEIHGEQLLVVDSEQQQAEFVPELTDYEINRIDDRNFDEGKGILEFARTLIAADRAKRGGVK